MNVSRKWLPQFLWIHRKKGVSDEKVPVQNSDKKRAIDLYSDYGARVKKTDPNITAVVLAPIKAKIIDAVAVIGYDRTKEVLRSAVQRKYRPSIVVDMLTRAINELGDTRMRARMQGSYDSGVSENQFDEDEEGVEEEVASVAPAIGNIGSGKSKKAKEQNADANADNNPIGAEGAKATQEGETPVGIVTSKTDWANILSIVAVVVIVIFLLFLVFAPTGTGGVPSLVSQAPDVPNLTPVDIVTSTTWTWVQYALMLGSLLLAAVVLLDRIKADEYVDFVGMAACVVLNSVAYLLIGYLLQYALEHLPPEYMVSVPIWTAKWIAAAIVQVIAIPLILFFAIKSGRKDYSILGGYWSITGAIGVVFSTLGAFQVLWFIPASSMLPLRQVWTLITLKMFPVVLLSLFIYARLFAALVVYLFEAVKDWSSLSGSFWKVLMVVLWRSVRMFGAPLVFIVGHVKTWNVPYIYMGFAILSLLFGFFEIKVSSATAKADSATPTPVGQGLFGLPAKFPFDLWAAHIQSVILYIAGSGHL